MQLVAVVGTEVMNLRLNALVVLLFASVTLATGCASQASQKTGEGGASSGEAQPVKKAKKSKSSKSNSGSKSESACTTGISLSLYDQGKDKIEGDELAVYTGRSKDTKSLCEVLEESGKKVAIFQFAGVFCISCQQEAQELRRELEASRYGDDIAHVVVMTDFFSDFADDVFQGFMRKFAPDSISVYDEAKLWKYFSQDPSEPNRATIMAMDLDMNAVILNQDGQQGGIVAAAEKMAKALKSAQEKNP